MGKVKSIECYVVEGSPLLSRPDLTFISVSFLDGSGKSVSINHELGTGLLSCVDLVAALRKFSDVLSDAKIGIGPLSGPYAGSPEPITEMTQRKENVK